MEFTTRTSLYLICLLVTTSCASSRKLGCGGMLHREFYFASGPTYKSGSVKLFFINKNKPHDRLNQLVVANSDLMFSESKNSVASLIKDGLTDTETPTPEDSPEHISTNLFCFQDILSYEVSQTYRGDKGAPYQEYLTIDLTHLTLLQPENMFVTPESLSARLNAGAASRKREIVDNYLRTLRGKADQLMQSYQDVFVRPDYSIQDIRVSTNSSDFSHFVPEGAVFNVQVNDPNFLRDPERNRIDSYQSYFTVPYPELLLYVKPDSALHHSIEKIIK